MTIYHVNEIREENKTSTSPWNLTLHDPLAKLTTVLGNEIKCAISHILYSCSSKDLQRTLRESSIRPVVNLSHETKLVLSVGNEVLPRSAVM